MGPGFISGTAAGSAYRAGSNAGMAAGSKMSSAIRGIIPKSTGGRMAAGGALAIAAGVASYGRSRNNGGRGANGVGLMAGGATAMLSPTARSAYGRL